MRVTLRRHTTGVVTFGDTGDMLTETDDVDVELVQQDAVKQLMRHGSVLFAGGVAGSVGKTVTAPLSRLTILFQVHSMVSTRHTDRFSPTVSGAFTKVLKNEGALAFWKGNGASVLHRFPYSAVNFFTFEMVKNGIIAQNHPAFTNNSTRLATQLNTDIRYTGIRHAVQRISTEEGFLGLYRGMGATLMVTVPNLAINFTLYESLKEYAREFRRSQVLAGLTGIDREEAAERHESTHLGVADTLCCGGAAGIASSLVTFPIDVVRRRLQISAIHAESAGIKPTPSGIASELFQTQGISGFYRGLTPELMKVVPMVGITFGTFERLKQLLTVED
ncbi:hypothetical protein BBJ29_005862 [Phytophthora kernoviae]|uniref:Mitochondrial carrier protein n=1 Tax=Phytophthora kernoviae TaxID=325452 RepID=A0A3F2RIN5_9STRA|nr:hypothetical protein BBP00_00007281 [Phytophthora kernoviae]RLN62017.1 hypothetical protein BBJ29_005862 [Phytophthora kernoviae]